MSELLFEEPYRFDFFQAMRLLQRLAPERVPVGEQDDPQRETVRLRSDISLGFPSSDISALEVDGENGVPRLTVAFLGIATPSSFGSLPLHYAEWVLEEEIRNKNSAPRDFLDLFNHRLISLFYRAWEKYRFPVLYERGHDPLAGTFERALRAVFGLGMPALADRLSFDDRALLYWAGPLAGAPMPASTLEEMLHAYFAVPIAVVQFIPSWYGVEPEDWSRLGQDARLGRDAFLGSRVQLSQSRFRVQVGPLRWSEFQSFLPTGLAFVQVVDMVKLAAGLEFDFDLELRLRAQDIPDLRLDTESPDDSHRLGWSTWLRSQPASQDASDTIVSADARAPRRRSVAGAGSPAWTTASSS